MVGLSNDYNLLPRLSIVPNPGRGTGIVIATGTQTEFGVIFSMMQDVRLYPSSR
jgi:magnesium-transporting ATPase (P-type)